MGGAVSVDDPSKRGELVEQLIAKAKEIAEAQVSFY